MIHSEEGMLCGLADGLDALRAHGVTMSRALLVTTVAAQLIRGSPTPHVREAYAEARDRGE